MDTKLQHEIERQRSTPEFVEGLQHLIDKYGGDPKEGYLCEAELHHHFTVLALEYPKIYLRRKSDGVTGYASLRFAMGPIFFDFRFKTNAFTARTPRRP